LSCRYSSVRHTHITEEIKRTITTKQTEVKDAITTANKQLIVLENKLEELNPSTDDEESAEPKEGKAEAFRQFEEEHNELKALLKLLAELLSRSRPDPERPETPPNPSALIPFSRDTDFVEREPILNQLNQKCTISGSWTALVGLGGVG
jgi:predicted unusual protein kinase regulating ubiquinone biosynthesis (AarF/ABC1/UbiB family)